jgi:hypothetical protein
MVLVYSVMILNVAMVQLQAVGYNSVEAEDWEIATRGEDIGKLETLLLDKNRKMEHELTQVKVWFLKFVIFIMFCYL